MNLVIADIELNKILVDETLFPRQPKGEFVYEHLRHYYSKLDTLPTIEIQILQGSAIVTKNHLYYYIAKDLGRTNIRAFIANDSSTQEVKNFLKYPYVHLLDWKQLCQEEEDEFISYMWFVFFFKAPLNRKNKNIFEREIVDFFKQIEIPATINVPHSERIKDLNYPYFQECAEFQAYLPVPVGGEKWVSESISRLINFHENYVPIISFQGECFQHFISNNTPDIFP